MGLGGRWVSLVLLLGALLVALEARAGDAGPLLVFEASAEGLPQAEIRAAVEKELGKPLATSSEAASGELSVAVDPEKRLVIRYRTPKGSTERAFPMPSEPSDIPLIVSLAAGNLARDPAASTERPAAVEAAPTVLPEDPPPPKPPEPPVDATEPEPPPAKAPLKRHFLGLHVAQDIAIVGGSNVCDANLGQKADNYACFYEGTDDEPFWHTPFPYEDGIDTKAVLATTRLLVSYDFAPAPIVSFGARFGYAFGGGPPAGQTPAGAYADQQNLNLIPAHTKGTGGTKFLRTHFELRAALWFLPLDGRLVSAYAGAGLGMAQVDAKTTVIERDCANTIENPATPGDDWDQEANGDYEDCQQGRSSFDWRELPETRVDAWKKLGQGFFTLTAGSLIRASDRLGVLVNLNLMYTFPSTGIVFEPSLGPVLAF